MPTEFIRMLLPNGK